MKTIQIVDIGKKLLFIDKDDPQGRHSGDKYSKRINSNDNSQQHEYDK